MSWRWGLAVVALLILGPLGATDPPDLRSNKDGSDWPRFLGPELDGRSPETAIDLHWSADGPPLLWVHPVGEGYSAPVTSRGRLFVFDRHEDAARLTCLKSETGEELWRSEYPTDYVDLYDFSNGPRASPVVDRERVYTYGVEGRLRCHRITDGKLIWEVDTRNSFGVVQNFFGVGSTPIVEKDLLIVPVGGSPPDSPSIRRGGVVGNGNGIVAFDKLNGKLRYQVTDELASYASPLVKTIDGRRMILAFMRGGLVGVDAESGVLKFHFPWRAKKLESVNAATPLVVGNEVLITESYGPGAALLRIEDGKAAVVWKDAPRDHALESHWMTPVYDEGWVFGSSGSGSGDAELRAVEWATGDVKWSQEGLGRSTILWVAGHLIVLTERGRLLVVEASAEAYRVISDSTPLTNGSDGDPLIGFPAWNAPVLSHGLLYVRGKDRLACFDLRPRAPADE